MFRDIHNRLNWRSGKARVIAAAAICAAGLAAGIGGTAVLAQVTGVNPTPVGEGQTVNNVLCEKGTWCNTSVFPASCSLLDVQFRSTCDEVNSDAGYNYTCNSLYPSTGAVCFQWTVSPCVTYWQGSCEVNLFMEPNCVIGYNAKLQNSGTFTTCVQEYP